MRTIPESTVKISYNSFFEIPKNLRISDILDYVQAFIEEVKIEFPDIEVNVNAKDIMLEFRKANMDVELTIDKVVTNPNYEKELEEYLTQLTSEVTRVDNLIKEIQTASKFNS